MKGIYKSLVAATALAGIALTTSAQAEGPTSADLVNDANTPDDVLTYGMGPWQQRFSKLEMIKPRVRGYMP